MKLLKTGIFAVALGLASMMSDKSFAEEEKIWTVGTDQGYVSQYIWRSTRQHNDGYQGDVYLTLWDMLSFNVWWDMPTKTTSGLKTSQAYEVDYTVDIAYAIDAWSFDLGHITYDFPQTAAGSVSTTHEIFLTVGYDTLLAPTLGIYYDYGNADGIYFQFDVSHSIEMSDWATLNFGASVGYAIDEGPDSRKDTGRYFQYYDKNSGFTSYDFSASADFSLAPISDMLSVVTVSPSFTYVARNTSMISGKASGAPIYGNDDLVTAINVNIEF